MSMYKIIPVEWMFTAKTIPWYRQTFPIPLYQSNHTLLMYMIHIPSLPTMKEKQFHRFVQAWMKEISFRRYNVGYMPVTYPVISRRHPSNDPSCFFGYLITGADGQDTSQLGIWLTSRYHFLLTFIMCTPQLHDTRTLILVYLMEIMLRTDLFLDYMHSFDSGQRAIMLRNRVPKWQEFIYETPEEDQVSCAPADVFKLLSFYDKY